MATVMEMPKLSDTMKEGAVGKWLKKEGDKVTAGSPVVEIETDKATMEFESPASGQILKILVGDGGTCALNAPIAVIGKDGENWQEALDKYTAKKGGAAAGGAAKPDAKKALAPGGAAPARPAHAASAPPRQAPAASAPPRGVAPASAPPRPGAVNANNPAPAYGARPTQTSAPLDSMGVGSGGSRVGASGPGVAAGGSEGLETSSDRVKASPLAKKLAADKGIDLGVVEGSGPNGRIVVRDVEGFDPAQAPAAESRGQGAATGRAPAAQAFSAGEVERVPLTNMRKTIAARLTESVVTNPHFYLTVSINMGPLLAWRKATLAKLPEDQKFSVNDLLVFLTSRALLKHPGVNASWQEDHVARYHYVNMSVAVALPTGLITPVVRNADSISLTQIAAATKDLIKRARDGKLAPDEYQGGTFTISNLGMSGIEEFTAIINPPQAAILAVGATIPTPVVNAKGEIVVEERMKVTLSSDHRVIDGAVGSEFLKTLKAYLEDPVAALFMM